jgi:hypothetical protein
MAERDKGLEAAKNAAEMTALTVVMAIALFAIIAAAVTRR